jgi:hypothetical protein
VVTGQVYRELGAEAWAWTAGQARDDEGPWLPEAVAGARWRFTEHRQDPPLLPPGTSWMQGAAGIAAFLLRLARVMDAGLAAPVVDRPDQWWAVPARLRTVPTGPPILPGQAGP